MTESNFSLRGAQVIAPDSPLHNLVEIGWQEIAFGDERLSSLAHSLAILLL